LSNSDLSRRFVHRTSDRSRSEVLCTHGGQPSELVQSPSENDIHAWLSSVGNQLFGDTPAIAGFGALPEKSAVPAYTPGKASSPPVNVIVA
ncbi:hypothetical protein ACXM5X_32735, partial [Pseudomonas saponiphila]